VNGTQLEVIERGSGDPIVFIHGSSSDHRTWLPTLDELGDGYRTIAYSRRHHWPNDPILKSADYSMIEHVDDLEALLGTLDVGPTHLVGHSYGAFVALLLAQRSPQRVRTLVLAEPPIVTLFVSNPPKPSELLGLLFRRPRSAAAIAHFGATGVAPATAAAQRGDLEAATRILGRAILGKRFYHELSSERLEQVAANAFEAEFLGSGFPPVSDAAVRDVRIPTLLLGGQHSPAIFPRVLDRLEELLPETERIEVPNASHLLHEDDPTTYHRALRSFLASHGAD